jgi:EPS-associated MarR family transcriptional regulator
LGKTNYCLRALIDKGLIKARNFKKAKVRSGYAYYLTPKGIEEKARITYRFLRRKMEEYEKLKDEIEAMKQEVKHHLPK